MASKLTRLFNLRRDQQDADTIDTALREGAQAAGTNLWVLFFAILIASVGLNVNSTAVIIGAMLISPLMGPIVGIGYAAAVFDFALIREASKNLALFSALSLLTSIIYFALSPLDQPQSELLARTSPTLWDVLIAAFGGAAGMVAVTRRSFSNIVPGVAIATALMPPLCTAGFALAHGRWTMFAGAAFLFTINGVFIAAATLAVAKLLRLPARGAVDEATRTRHRAIIAVGLTAVLVPAAWLGYRFVQNEVFNNAANNVGRQLLSDTRVLAYEVDAPGRTLRLTTVGERDLQQLKQRAQDLLKTRGEAGGRVDVRRAGDDPLDVGALRKDLNEELKRTLLAQVQQTDLKVSALEQKLGVALVQAQAAAGRRLENLQDEIRAQVPAVQGAYLAQALMAPAAATAASAAAHADGSTIVVVDVTRPLHNADRQRLERWLAVRLQRREVSVVDRIVRSQPAPKR
jgi:uncharacterized hydrophobic protein (TIGR00271 family)